MSKNAVYYRMLLKNVDSNLEDEISGWCFQNQASGVVEEIDFKQMSRDYTPELIQKEKIDLQVFFEESPSQEFLEGIRIRYPKIEIEFTENENKDWMHEWKKGFVAFCLAEEYWIVPSWLSQPKEANKVIWIDPGMAFGTGTHETTQLASSIILRKREDLFYKCKTCLDVGTGTGILAILARKEFATQVITTEIDADARIVARENFLKNKSDDIELPEYQIEDLNGEFDLVIANIIDGVLLDLKQELLTKTKVGFYMILTGILEEREENFKEKFIIDDRLEILERTQKNEWVGYLVKRLS